MNSNKYLLLFLQGSQHHAHRDGHTFTFDKCFSGLATQVEIYNTLILPLLNSCLEGYNATTLAYGQTGAGKCRETLESMYIFAS